MTIANNPNDIACWISFTLEKDESMYNNKNKLIAIFTNHVDDIYCFRKEFVERLIELKTKILIVCPYGDKFKLMYQLPFLYENIDIDRRGINLLCDFKLLLSYLHIIKKYRPDFVLCYTIKPNIYASLSSSLYHIPYINNITGLGSIIHKPKYIQHLILFLYRIALRKSSCVFFQNKYNMQYFLKNNIIKGKTRLIPGSGVNTANFKLQPYPDDDQIVFNYIGRILKDKGIDDYLEAALEIKKRHANTRFNVIGFIEPTEAIYAEKLNVYQEKGIISYYGNQTDIRPFIAQSHATIHPSKYGEGMSNVLLESASSGRPLITTDIPGCIETVSPGESGYIYKSGSVKELIEKIEEFLLLSNEQRRQMGMIGRKYIEDNFSRELVINAYIEELSI